MRKARLHCVYAAERTPAPERKPDHELAIVADRLIRQFGTSRQGRTYALRLIGVYTVVSELGMAAFREYGYTREQTAYFVGRLRNAGVTQSEGL